MANTADDWLYNDDLDVSLPGVRIDIPDLAIMFMIVQHKCILLPLISLLSHFIRPLDTMGICLTWPAGHRLSNTGWRGSTRRHANCSVFSHPQN
ncbi:hypothetical protein GBAR_LOCUS12424 [Geodia barretti]|uniref:Uncharacterized protein n=1 Tax=Geodia barretti TaxID=519541 RepID=A0AA35S0T7_GEOBA|nr:hypothetical protein GBAR_LOCUS12424 [Geodia barretti]